MQPIGCILKEGISVSQHFVPTVIEQTARGERSFDIYSRLLQERIVMLGTQVDDASANLIVAQLLHLEAEDPDKDINLYINSPGGSAYAGLAIYDTMQYIKPRVATICVGMAMSMSAVLLGAGARGKRFALPNAKVMIHQGSSGFEGSPADIDIRAREVLSVVDKVIEIIAKHTNKSLEQVREDIDRDRFLTAQEAEDYGIVDEVITQRGLRSIEGYVPGFPGPREDNGHKA
jgi:ATP-dependent Clp protease, protease subunit